MGNPFSKETQKMTEGTKVELYLKDEFERECAYKIEQEEVEFIKSGIETIVKRIANKVLDNDTLQESMKVTFEKYFKGKMTRSSKTVFGVGSFYEGTRNNFPDEFDFILTLFSCEGTFEEYKQFLLEASVFNTVSDTFSQKVKELSEVDKNALLYTASDPKSQRKLYFGKYLRQHGPATWLRFIYENESNRKKEIDVDYVAALHITNMDVLNMVVNELCVLTEFAKETLSVGSCFCIGANFSLTQTEVRIMKTILSENHRKIYRILKYLINGHGDVDKLNNLGSFDKAYSSYMIKTVMIYHHYNCKTLDTVNLGPCILDVLDNLCKYKNTSEFPSLYKVDYRTKIRCDLCLLTSLRSLTDCLRTMQRDLGSSYNYERDKIRDSISKKYHDTLGK
ncbi:uncharacterized protein LOC134723669 [Mytilus trossulus]|uniref:uncharacterized protein LOC134723669 n=1 Tax=Mytilus trossulus TaxID=6551 RepID=UPI0030043FA2